MAKLQPIARKHEKRNSYVFVTRQTSRGTRDYAGWGFVGVVCSRDQGMRVNLNRGTKRVMSFALVLIFLFHKLIFLERYVILTIFPFSISYLKLCIIDSGT